jgi:hypothetical protein
MSEEIDPQPIMSEERTFESYTQLLTDYSTFERELGTLENLQYNWETTLAREKYNDEKLYAKINSSIRELSNKILESSEICDYIDNSPYEDQCYRLFKENFDNINGFKFPETSKEFLDYILDYYFRVTDIVVRQTNTLYSTDLSTLMGFDVERTPGYQ